ncbi:bactofilin family protein [Rugosibacter aromaticivorans]|uniref:bactofilin family protein n=1 Tax=Rugosibacter aromaticivorans TaxID=1565605 RepID=UPI000A516187|nr:polymer-forming cytoskeletal protein [Rugosibacter aromaticivorans]TBR14926.1 MAG: polymer-forming cytoskeletal protein [Rugosibacter sp.]
MLKTPDFTGKSDGSNNSRGLFGRPSSPMPAPAQKPVAPQTLPIGDTANPIPATLSTPAAQPKAETGVGNCLLVGPDVKLKGAEILDCDTLVVEGRVEATMDSHIIRIAEQGTFCGTVSIDTAEIHGSFEGELTARNQLVIHATGRVTGKIRYGKILIEEGGQICGDIQSTAASTSSLAVKAESGMVVIAARA